ERGDPRAIPLQMMRRLWDLAYETHPYAKALRGTPESIGQITHTRATEYYERFYAPGNISLLVVGAVTPGEAVAAAASTLGRIPRRDVRWQRPDPEPPQTDARKDTVLVPAPRHAFMMAFHGPGIDDKRDVCAMDVIYTILGQGERSRLLRVLRDEQKVVLSAEVEFITRRDPGLFIVTCIAAPDREQAAREGVLQQIQRLADEPLPPDELAQAKKLLRDAYAFSNETLADQTGSMGFYDSIDTYKFALDYIAEVNKVTVKDVQSTVRRYLRPDAYTLVVARPAASGAVKEAALQRWPHAPDV
ncbi:MAG: pitrilysin family protein, partial [Armatimonadota bacterium]